MGAAATSLALLMAKWHAWGGGWCYGPRLLTEAAMLLALILIVTFGEWKRRDAFRRIAVVLAALSVGIHALHVFRPTYAWEGRHEQIEAAAFSLSDTQIGEHLRHLFGRDVRHEAQPLDEQSAPR